MTKPTISLASMSLPKAPHPCATARSLYTVFATGIPPCAGRWMLGISPVSLRKTPRRSWGLRGAHHVSFRSRCRRLCEIVKRLRGARRVGRHDETPCEAMLARLQRSELLKRVYGQAPVEYLVLFERLPDRHGLLADLREEVLRHKRMDAGDSDERARRELEEAPARHRSS